MIGYKALSDKAINSKYDKFKKMVLSNKVKEVVVPEPDKIVIQFKDGQIMGAKGPLALRFICEHNLKVEVPNEH